MKNILKQLVISFISLLTFTASYSAQATIVEVETNFGSFQINLFDTTTPITVKNFLSYVDDGAYTDTVFHRLERGFVLQGGGFTFNGEALEKTATNAPITNEPFYSNVKWTVAMAKTSDPDSATNQWFINLTDNDKDLDIKQNAGGFTVFGQVVAGFEVIDQITDITICGSTPIKELNQERCDNWDLLTIDDFVHIIQITVVDSSAATADNLKPIKNTLRAPDQDSGGSIAYMLLMLFTVLAVRKSA